MTTALSLRRLTKRFPGGVTALDDVSLDAADGEFVAVLGGGGAGKTTLLRIIAGLDDATSGEIRFFGEPAAGRRAGARPVSMMFQSQALFPHLSTAENIAYGLARGRRPDAETRDMVDGLIALAGLAGRAATPPKALSPAERRRLAFARSLARRPRVLLLDAPTAGLDDADRAGLQETLATVLAATGITTLLATDDADEAARLAQRIAVLDGGAVAETGAPADLRDRPASRAAARLVGRMNLLAARLVDDGAGPTIAIEGVGARPARGLAGVPGRFTLGVPPDAITVSRVGANGAIAGFVRGLAFLGGRRHVLVDTADGASLVVLAPPERLADGDAVWLDWDDGRTVALER